MIYNQQVSRLAAASFLPTYQNNRLRFKLNITSIATHLFGIIDNFKGLNRHLRIACVRKFQNTTAFHEVWSFTLSFLVKTIDVKQVNLTLQYETFAAYSLIRLPISAANKQADVINIEINRTFPIDIVFSFTYQWTDSDVVNSFKWPEWPLQRACIESIEYRITQNDFPCLFNNTLTHLTSRQVFIAERTALICWLDKQYDASISYPFSAEYTLPSKAKTRRLSPIELSLNTTICSPEFNNWISTYQQWHENITTTISHSSMTFEQQRDRILDLNIRFLLYEKPTTGIADRILHLMTTYLVAVLTNRLFLFDSNWLEFFDIMHSKLNFEQTHVIPWYSSLHILNANLSVNHSKYITSQTHATSFRNIDKIYDYDKEFPERILLFQGHMGRIVQIMISNTSIYRKFLTDDLHMSPDNMFGCLYHSLLIHRLATLIESTSTTISDTSFTDKLGHSPQQMLRVMLSPMFFPIGIQVRGLDTLNNNDFSDRLSGAAREETFINLFKSYIGCARDIIVRNQALLDNSGQLPVGFLLSNAIGVRKIFLKHWQLPPHCLHSFKKDCYKIRHALYILSNPDPVLHISYTSQSILALQQAMFDIFLFGFCERHIITTDSGFGRIAVFVSLEGRNIYSMSMDEMLSCRNDSQAISLVDSAYHWSGI